MSTFADELKTLARQTEPARTARAEQQRLDAIAKNATDTKRRQSEWARMHAKLRAQGRKFVDDNFDALQTQLREHVKATGNSHMSWKSQRWNDKDSFWNPDTYEGAVRRLKQRLGKGFTIDGDIKPHNDLRGDCWGYDMHITIRW